MTLHFKVLNIDLLFLSFQCLSSLLFNMLTDVHLRRAPFVDHWLTEERLSHVKVWIVALRAFNCDLWCHTQWRRNGKTGYYKQILCDRCLCTH